MKSIASTLVVCGLLSILGRSSVFELNADAPSLLTVLNAWQTYLGITMILAGIFLHYIQRRKRT